MFAESVRCLLLRAGWRLSAGVYEPYQLFEAGWRWFTWVCELCQLITVDWRLSTGTQDDGYLSAV